FARLPGCLPVRWRPRRRRDGSATDLRLLPVDAPARPCPRAAPDGGAPVNGLLALSTFCLICGGLLLAHFYFGRRRPALSVRLARAQGAAVAGWSQGWPFSPIELPAALARVLESNRRDLRRAGAGQTLPRFLAEKALLAVATPLVPLLPYAAAVGRLPSAGVALLFALAGFFVPDLLLRHEVRRRREAIFLDLPEAISVLALALRAGQ